MIKSFITIVFGSIFIAFPALSESCNPDFSLIPTCSEVSIYYQSRSCKRVCLDGVWTLRGFRCNESQVQCFKYDDNGDRQLFPSAQVPWTDGVIDNQKGRSSWNYNNEGYYPIIPFRLYIHDSSYLYLSESNAKHCPNIMPSINGMHQHHIANVSEFRITKVIYQDPVDPDQKIDLCDPPSPCPDLNLTIRGTLLPAHQGIARISGDWCN